MDSKIVASLPLPTCATLSSHCPQDGVRALLDPSQLGGSSAPPPRVSGPAGSGVIYRASLVGAEDVTPRANLLWSPKRAFVAGSSPPERWEEGEAAGDVVWGMELVKGSETGQV